MILSAENVSSTIKDMIYVVLKGDMPQINLVWIV